MNKSQHFARQVIENKGITLKELFFYIKSKMILLPLFAGAFVILALLKTCSTPDEYQSTAKILPEAQSFQGASLGLASLLGGSSSQNLLQQNDGITPELYPSIVLSNQFLLDLLDERFYFSNLDSEISLSDYFLKYEKEDWLTQALKFPRRIPSIIKSIKTSRAAVVPPTDSKRPVADLTKSLPDSKKKLSDSAKSDVKILNLNGQQMASLSKLKERIVIGRNLQLFIITVTMPDPEVAALVNRMVIDRLTDFLVKYKTEKEQKNFDFISEQLAEAEKKYLQDQRSLAAFRDQNRGLIGNIGMSRQEQLQTEYRLSSNVYTNLAQQLEQARIKVQEARPVLGIIEPPQVPLTRSAPTPVKTAVIFGLIGAFFGVIVVFGQLFWAFFKIWIETTESDHGNLPIQ